MKQFLFVGNKGKAFLLHAMNVFWVRRNLVPFIRELSARWCEWSA